jgi:hypothetical protein
MKKIIFAMTALFALSLLPVMAVPSTNPADYLFFDNGDNFLNGTIAYAPADGNLLSSYSYALWAQDSSIYDDDGFKDGNMSIYVFADTNSMSNEFDLGSELTNVTFSVDFYDPQSNQDNYGDVRLYDGSGSMVAQVGIYGSLSASSYYCSYSGGGNIDSTHPREVGWHTFHISLSGTDMWMGDHGTNFTPCYDSTSAGVRYIRWQNDPDHEDFTYYLDNIRVWRGGLEDEPQEEAPPAGDTTPPTVTSTSINNTYPLLGDIIQFSASCTDETSMASMYFANNLTGTMTNVSSITGLTALSNNYSANITDTAGAFSDIAGQFTCVDNSSNSVQSSLIEYYGNAVYIDWEVLSPTDGIMTNSQIISFYYNLTYLGTPYPETINFVIDGIVNQTQEKSEAGVYEFNYTTSSNEATTYNVQITSDTDNTSVKEISIDRVHPLIVPTSPAGDNSSVFDDSVIINIFSSNGMNITYVNASIVYNGNEIWNFTSTPNTATYTINETINASGFDAGTYYLYIFAEDEATNWGTLDLEFVVCSGWTCETYDSCQPEGYKTCLSAVGEPSETCTNEAFEGNLADFTTSCTYVAPARTSYGIYSVLSETGNGIGTMVDAIKLPVGRFALFLGIIGGVVVLIAGLVFAIKTMFKKVM